MKYSLMSANVRDDLKTQTPYFGDVLKAQELGMEPKADLTLAELRAFLESKGVPCREGTMTFEDFVVLAKKLGYQGIDMMSQLLELPGQEVRAILEKHDMKLSCVNVVSAFSTANTEQLMQEKLAEVFMNIDKVADSGAEYLLIMPAYTYKPDNISRETCYQQMLYGMKESAAYAKKRGVTLTTETLQFIKNPYCSTGEILRILQDVPELTFTLDTGNCLPMLEDPVEIIEVVADRLVGVHMKDMDFVEGQGDYAVIDGRWLHGVPYGSGIVNYAALYRKLAEVGFDGWIAFEGVSRAADPKQGLAEDLAWFRSLEV